MALFLSFENKPHFIYLVITNTVIIMTLHYLCSGIIEFIIASEKVEIKFQRKPVLTFLNEEEIWYKQIKKWDHITYNDGPDSLLIHLKSGKKIRLTFRLFACKNNYDQLIDDFKKWIEEEKSKTPNEAENAYNITEHFYNSPKANFVGAIFVILFSLDFTLMLVNAWELRKLFGLMLIPLIIGGMLYLIKYKLFRSNNN